MLLLEQPKVLCKREGIGIVELEEMVTRSAPFTHEWANRRWKNWIFKVDLKFQTLSRMDEYTHITPRYAPTQEVKVSNFMESDCPECFGEGCDHCRNTGVVMVKVVDKPPIRW